MGVSIPIYILAIAWGLVARVHAPSDSGGVFLECWTLLVFGMSLSRINSWTPGAARFVLAHVLALLSLGVTWGSTIYAEQILVPLAVFGFGMLLLTNRSKEAPPKLWDKLIGTIMVLLAVAWSAYALQRMVEVSKFLQIKSEEVEKIQIGDRTWTEPGDLMALCQALHCTKPYSPNHESKTSIWQATVVNKNGTLYSFQIARGNQVYPETAWLQFGVEVYQNSELGALLDQPRFRISPLSP